jgi:hypothetical protein
MYWFNPIAWAMKSFALLEFTSDRYDSILDDGSRLGNLYLEAYGFTSNVQYIWAALIYLSGLYIVFLGLTTLVLNKVRFHSKAAGGASQQLEQLALPAFSDVEMANKVCAREHL